jgi:hypothetical protein
MEIKTLPTIVEMSKTIADATLGTMLLVRSTGGSSRPTRYEVVGFKGGKARELQLEGQRGARRVLTDGGTEIWIREYTGGQRRARTEEGHRRVLSVEFADRIVAKPVVDPIARARLPDSYEIGRTRGGFVALFVDSEAGPEREDPWDAVFDAWEHEVNGWAEERDAKQDAINSAITMVSTLTESNHQVLQAVADAEARHAETKLALADARADAKRCRIALQQILEMTRGQSPSGAALPKVGAAIPEQVAAHVGQALRVESMRPRGETIAVRSITDGVLAWAGMHERDMLLRNDQAEKAA